MIGKFKNARSEERYLATYDEIAARRPVPVRDLDIGTRHRVFAVDTLGEPGRSRARRGRCPPPRSARTGWPTSAREVEQRVKALNPLFDVEIVPRATHARPLQRPSVRIPTG
ncbi:hypothetical protein AMES_3311 [Amycolatopsis mediterranei S699]|uniref:Uncharacterized protein n=2 Tax=Amycolatopsis mediterranei TaxID=33910 RepID=A0A0H3D4L5_AMYMU|nr:hypothetical protein [Amycolatopsis mediterranei]ADJ45137.1 hypothetical protein AMED_3351 [Amycolatopsis mediterranei U32]AEK41896.1 hypothetical protein RAM_17040 [Amycolatopsis mediterranei S699]AFO76847.1 hypothetical protein AMES_3311 [Amycolatopsis mediterranei S699]AGT83975.1 hypothetical protein B737_3311 [Amycolatopsis mediterranei RB]KDO08612.1 hypothetical protein DV26_22095 [Amycolatopsis mediterranei]